VHRLGAMRENIQTKRFIAGAICPSCQAVDHVTLLREATYQQLECMACGYQQKMETSIPLK
jgi:uncharacterized protein